MTKLKKNDTYLIDFISVSDKRISRFIFGIILVGLILCLLLFAFGMIVLYTYAVSKGKNGTSFNWSSIAQNLSGSAVLFSTALTLLVTITTAYLDKKYKILQHIINKILANHHKKLHKQYGINEIHDNVFILANEIVSHIKKPDWQMSRFYNLDSKYKIDYYELIFAIYQQLYGLKDIIPNSQNATHNTSDFNDEIKRIVLYDFSSITGTEICKEVLDSYKDVSKIADVIIIANRNYLSFEDRYRVLENFKSQCTLANSIFDLNENSTFIIKPNLDRYGINISDINSYDEIQFAVVLLIIIDSVFGFIPIKLLDSIFSHKEQKNILKLLKRRQLVGKPFKIRNGKAIKLHQSNVYNFLESHESKNTTDIDIKERLQDNLLKCLMDLQMFSAHLEMSALFNKFDADTVQSLEALIDKDCFNIAFQYMNLYPENDVKDELKTIYFALILERCGQISETNRLLSKFNNMPLKVDINGKLSFKAMPYENIKLFGKYASVLFENTHGLSDNRATILALIDKLDMIATSVEAQKQLSNDLNMYNYWKYHINLESGNFLINDYNRWIINYRRTYFSNRNNYSYLHNLRRAYSDYANCIYLDILGKFDATNNDNKCYSMLETINDSFLISDLACYHTHFRRMAVGDLIMNYCLPNMQIKNEALSSKIKVYLLAKGYNNSNFSAENLIKFALQTYNDCLISFEKTQDKSANTTRTRICAAQLMCKDESLDYDNIDKTIRAFYEESKFEVFISYGIALRLKLYLLKFMETNIRCLNEILIQDSDIQKNNLAEINLINTALEITKIFNDEILGSQLDMFSAYSKKRFEMFRCFLVVVEHILLGIKESKINAVTSENASLEKCISSIQLLKGTKLTDSLDGIESIIADNIQNNSYAKIVNDLRYYPIILL